MVKGIIFDLDGTIIDSPLCFDTIRKELDIPKKEYIIEYLEKIPDQEDRKNRFERLVKMELEFAKDAVIKPGTKEFIELVQGKNIFTAIFTRNCTSVVDSVCKKFQIYFPRIVTREDAPAKPDPTGILQLLDQWKIRPSEAVYLGDFDFDVEVGERAGVPTAIIKNGRALKRDPNFLFESFSELPSLLRI